MARHNNEAREVINKISRFTLTDKLIILNIVLTTVCLALSVLKGI